MTKHRAHFLNHGSSVSYRAHFLDHGGHTFSVTHFDAQDDEAAKAYSAKAFECTIGKGYQIWHGDRLVQVKDY